MKGLNDRQRRFAELVVQGVPAGRAYEQAGYNTMGNASEAEASRMIRNPKVSAYIATLRKEAETGAGMTRDEMVADLIKIVKSKPSEASMDNPLCELKMSKAGPYAAFPDKSRCMERLSRLLGWDEPEKHKMEFEVVIGGNAEAHGQD